MLLLVRRPLLLMLLLGVAVSLAASSRFTLRLILDGALSFAFIPLSELGGFAIVYWLRPPALPVAEAADRFFAGNAPWLWWWLVFMIASIVIPVLRHGEIMAPLLISSLIPIVLSVFIDTRFFRDVMGRSRGRARIDVGLQRLVAWPAAIAYFLGMASSSRDFFYLFRRDRRRDCRVGREMDVMTPRVAIGLLVASIVVGTAVDRAPVREPIVLGGYRVVAADFHTHSSTWSDGALTPWGLVLEAQHQGLDAIAVTGHRQTQDARWARWFSERIGGPTVLIGEEIPEIPHHVVAVGITETVDSSLDVAAQIAEIHRQGGVAIAAHPGEMFWKGFEPVMDRLDGTEICHPAIYQYEGADRILEQFASRTPAAAIGSSDFHGLGRLGLCRTFVFARDASAAAIVDAIRANRTLVYGRNGQAYGNPELITLAAADGRLPKAARPDYSPSTLDRVSQLLGLAGLAGLILLNRRS